mmetsp:Transcript_11580/g.24608  ORF Transcript_11580/g.24608 Transcript_11580/m.24608 type:complete len:440 (+) Transcript_11580:122-1441(+)
MEVSDEGTTNFQGGVTGVKDRAEEAHEPSQPASLSSDKPTSVLNGPEQSKARESSGQTSEASAAEEKGSADNLNLSELKLGEGQAGEDEDGPVKLFVGGLAWETTEESLQKVFEKYGEIVEVLIMRHPRTMCSRGFGFITLAKRSEAKAACNNKHTIDGRVVEAKISAAPGQGTGPAGGQSQAASKRRKVFVGGLSAETTDEDFRKYFEQFGEIAESQILQDHYTGRSRGFGFITFTTEEATEKVFAKGRFHELKGKLVEVKSATPRNQNKANSRGGVGMRGGKSQNGGHRGGGGGNGRGGRGGGGGGMRNNFPHYGQMAAAMAQPNAGYAAYGTPYDAIPAGPFYQGMQGMPLPPHAAAAAAPPFYQLDAGAAASQIYRNVNVNHPGLVMPMAAPQGMVPASGTMPMPAGYSMGLPQNLAMPGTEPARQEGAARGPQI